MTWSAAWSGARSRSSIRQSRRPSERSDETILTVRDLGDGDRFDGVSFELRKGEILGIGGLIGSGRTEIAEGDLRIAA